MNRSELVKKLEVIKPGLSSRDFIPILSHFCFVADEYVFSYNDLIAMRVPCKTPIDGAVKGNTLLSILATMEGDQVDLIPKGTVVNLTSGRTSIDLPTLKSDEFLFSFPSYSNTSTIPFDAKRKHCINRCLLTCGVDTSSPQYMGVTVEVGDHLALYSTDGVSITAYQDLDDVEFDKSSALHGTSFVLPLDFCKVISDVHSDYGDATLHIAKDKSFVVAAFNGCEVFSKLPSVDPPDFATVLGRHLSQVDSLVDIPSGFTNMLYRSSVIASSNNRATLTVENDSVKLEAQSNYGQSDDEVDLTGHPDVVASFNPALVRNVIANMESMRVTNEIVYVGDGEVDHLVANFT